MDDVETSALRPRANGRSSSFIQRWSVGDWLATIAISLIGLWADHLPAVERVISPQLNDPAISYPHTPKDEQKCTASMLWKLSFWLPLLLLAPVAMYPPRGVPSSRFLSELWLGLSSSVASGLAVVCIVKAAVGRLRPDFLARCVPVNGVCTGVAKEIAEGRRSFPSGHATLSFAGLAYVSFVYFAALSHAPTPRAGNLWKVVVVALPWTLALLISLSRVSDYWHHWQDILVGSLIGHASSIVAFRLRFAATRDPLGHSAAQTAPLLHKERCSDPITENGAGSDCSSV